MTRPNEASGVPASPDTAPGPGPGSGPFQSGTSSATRVLVVDADRALLGLLQEWLDAQGCTVVSEQSAGADSNQPTEPTEQFALAIVDVPFPRTGGSDQVQRVAAKHPGTPILALSCCFFASIECQGAVARALGAACVLPQPASREALTNAVRQLLSR